MVYTYTPAYYSSLQDSITSLCKTILPFSLKKRGLPAAEQKLSKQQTDYLKWQQESFHRILNLVGLHREGILPESEVSEFRSHLIEAITASKGTEHEQPAILKDKLLFLQELLFANCISDEEYQAANRPLLQRLAAQAAQMDGGGEKKECADEEWSVIDLKDEQCLLNKDGEGGSKSKLKPRMKHLKGAAAKALGFGGWRSRREKSIFDELGSGNGEVSGGGKQWGLNSSGLGEGPDTRQTKKKLQSDGSASDSLSDMVLGDSIKKELARIQAELSSTNTNIQFTNDEMETISTKLPADKSDLQKFFPKSWCDRHGEVVLDVVKKEFKGHTRRTTFDEDGQNSHPNLFSHTKHLRRGDGNQSFSNPFWNSTTLET